jgi:hypothetical protein
MKEKSGKTTLQIGDSVRARVPEPCASEVDHCQLSTRSGKVILGFSGEDSMPELVKERDMWQKLGAVLRGSQLETRGCIGPLTVREVIYGFPVRVHALTLRPGSLHVYVLGSLHEASSVNF